MLIAGVDEAGRGPLVGPVIAAAVILDPQKPILGLKDSKRLTAKQRAHLFDQIQSQALCYGIAAADSVEIDQLNILQATLLAMQRALSQLRIQPAHVYVDGLHCPKIKIPCTALVKGDDLMPAISAASILAKVTRDQQLVRLSEQYPLYGFAQHKGYPTVQHITALKQYGPCPEHRRSFAPVKALLNL